ncbi:hypothetical protein [Micromonospora endolithica]|uniref:Uncharacterized protein n=1 Tax=Micromonospora endolithica TaxID=230091 RepID=A0A3A9YSG5_9ACTN|nr:hypothetical protein [Micromonospora endolithica]RKN38444.1 hypothetical protein D7223_31050 [Micromonospora endolithica]TWJ23136.1 hypothetical protein JD76_03265 [Micromonospora endolithica]
MWEPLPDDRWRFNAHPDSGDIGIHLMRLVDGVFGEYYYLGVVVRYRIDVPVADPLWPLTDAVFIGIDYVPVAATEDEAWQSIDAALGAA